MARHDDLPVPGRVWHRLLRVKGFLLLLAVAGFSGGCLAAYSPGPSPFRWDVSFGPSAGFDSIYPLRATSSGFFLFAAACALGAAWVQAAEVRTRGFRRSVLRRPAEADFEVVDE